MSERYLAWVEDIDWRGNSPRQRVIAKAEPDYEAATAKLIEQGPSDFSDENVARNIIHAAFKGAGIGDNDWIPEGHSGYRYKVTGIGGDK